MAEDNLVLEQLRKIRAELDAARERDHEIMARLSGIEIGLARIARDEAGHYAEIIQDRYAIDRIRERLDRIERRLELTELTGHHHGGRIPSALPNGTACIWPQSFILGVQS